MQVTLAGTPRITGAQSLLTLAAAAPNQSAPTDSFASQPTDAPPAPKPKPVATMPARALYTVGCGVVGVFAGITAFGGPIGALGGAFGAYYGYKNADDVSTKNAAIIAGLTIGGAVLGNAVAGTMGAAAGAVLGFIGGETIRHR